MSTVPEYLIGSVEYVKVRVTSSASLTSQPVEILLNGDELPATWIGDAGTTRVCRTTSPVDFSLWTDALYGVQVRVTDVPEVPLIPAGNVRVQLP